MPEALWLPLAVVPCSAISGDGLGDLRQALEAMLDAVSQEE